MTQPHLSQPSQPSSCILIVDDEEIVLVALRETLRQQGYEVETAPNAVRGLELLRERTFAVVLSDQQMPTLTGLEFLVEVKKLQPNATRILITAGLSVAMLMDAINKAEVFRFILKPWQRDELLRAVAEGLVRYQAAFTAQALLARARAESDRQPRRSRSAESSRASHATGQLLTGTK